MGSFFLLNLIDICFIFCTVAYRKEESESSSEPHFLLNESGEAEVEYVPTQFHNSLGRLQVRNLNQIEIQSINQIRNFAQNFSDQIL